MNPSKGGSRFRDYRDAVARSHQSDYDARVVRAAELAVARSTCERDRKRTTRDCGDRRRRIRDHANDWLSQQKTLRRIERMQLRKGRMTASENDSLAEHNIDPEYYDAWRMVRHRFDYDRTPDDRAVLFGEYLSEGGAHEWQAIQEDQAADIDWDAEQLAQHEEAVPF